MARPTNDGLNKQWNEFADSYEHFVEPSTCTIAHVLMNAIGVGNEGEEEHERIIDVCCGSGDAARLFCLLRRNESIALEAVDISEVMVTKCTQKVSFAKNVNFQVGDALNLPFPNEHFTGYYSNLGLQLVPDDEQMISEAYRVLKPNGRAAYTIWGIPEKSPFMTLLPSILRQYLSEDQLNPKTRSNFHLGGNRDLLKSKFSQFSSFVSWSQPMVIAPITAEYVTKAILSVPTSAKLVASLDEKIQNEIKNSLFSKISEILNSNNCPISLDVEIIYVRK